MAEAQRDEIAKLEALYAANPEGRVFTHLAEAYRKAGELDRAKEILEDGLGRHPDSATGFVVLGRVAYDRGDAGEARGAFRRALELDGGNLVAHRYLGELALAAGDRSEALLHYNELLSRNPTDEALHRTIRELSAPPPPTEAEVPELAVESPAAFAEAAATEAPAETEPPVPAMAEPAGFEPTAYSPPEPETFREEPGPAWVEAGMAETAPAPAFPFEGAAAEPPSAEPEESTAPPAEEPPAWYDGAATDAWESVEEAGEPSLPGVGELSAGAWEAEAFALPAEEAEPLPELSFEGQAEPAGTSAEPWSWDEPAAAPPAEAGEAWPAPEFLEPLPESEAVEEAASFEFLAPLPEPDFPEEEYLQELPPFDLGAGEPQEEPEAEPASLDLSPAPAEPDFLAGPELPDTTLDAGFFEPPPAFEDLDLAPSSEGGEGASGEPAPAEADAGEVLPELAAEVPPGAAGADVVTETMAELYRTQGFHERAAEVYRSLLERMPGDPRLQQKLAEVEAEIEDSRAAAATLYRMGAEEEEEARDAWMKGVESAFTGGAGAAEEATTPYAWDTGTEEPVAAGPPISDYFRGLLGWRPTGGRRELGAPPADQEPWRPGEAAAPEPSALEATPPPPAPGGAYEPLEELVLEEPALEPEPEAAFLGWTPDMLDQPTPATAATPPEASDLMPWEVAEPPSLATPAEAAPAAEPAAGRASPEPEPTEEDEDLEMFRSWLQSLKK